jgi:aspartate aminotransferase
VVRDLLAQRVETLAVSPTMAISERARALRATGVDVLDLASGEPDFVTPAAIREATKRALDAGDTHYVSPAGVPALREAISNKLRIENGITVAPSQVLVTPGGKAALFVAIQALVEPGVEVLLAEPAWVSFRPMVELAGGSVRTVALTGDFRFTAEALEASVGPKTKLLLVNSPCNPTGRVLDDEERTAIAKFAIAHDLVVIADEIYERIVYPPNRHVSLASLPGMADRTLTVNGFSKAFAMTGWRIGYLAGPSALVAAAAKVHGHFATCANSFAQAGAIEALRGDSPAVEEMVAAWARRRQFVCTAINAMTGFRCPLPDGAFYAWVDVRRTGMGSQQVASALLDAHHLAVVPGPAFGASAEGFLRLSFATSDQTLERALLALESFTTQLPKESP